MSKNLINSYNSFVKLSFLQVQVLNLIFFLNYKRFDRNRGYKDFFFQILRVFVFPVLLTNFLYRKRIPTRLTVDDPVIQKPTNLPHFTSFITNAILTKYKSLSFFTHLILFSIIHVYNWKLKFTKFSLSGCLEEIL